MKPQIVVSPQEMQRAEQDAAASRWKPAFDTLQLNRATGCYELAPPPANPRDLIEGRDFATIAPPDHFADAGKIADGEPQPPTVADITLSLAFVGALVAVGFAGWFIAREIFAIIAPALAGLAAALVFLAKLAVSAVVVLPLGYFFLRPRSREQAWMPPDVPRKAPATKCAPVVQQIIIVNPPAVV